jgi:uncharacterized protein (DUF2342 family)
MMTPDELIAHVAALQSRLDNVTAELARVESQHTDTVVGLETRLADLERQREIWIRSGALFHV